jgi:aminopeptidase N
MSLLIEEGAGNRELMHRLPPPQWYAAQDGLKTVEALIAALEMEPQQLGSEGEQVLSELLEYRRVLEKTREREMRWHLAVSWR